jgi:hypothetical protein
MSLVYTQRKDYTIVSSSYFDDYKMIKEGMRELKADKWVNKKECPDFDFAKLELANVVQLFILAKNGAREVSAFADSLPTQQLDKYRFNYGPWKEVDEDDTSLAPILDS